MNTGKFKSLLEEYGYGFMKDFNSDTTMLLWDTSDKRMMEAEAAIVKFVEEEKKLSWQEGYAYAEKHQDF